MADEKNTPRKTVDQIMQKGRALAAEAAARKARELEAAVPADVPADKSRNSSLEPWADSARGVPNVLLRNALFGIATERKVYFSRTLIASTKDIEIRFMGVAFNQTDLDVFEMLLHLARLQPLGQSFEFSAHEFLTALGRGTGKTQHEQLKDELMRLMTGGVEISFIEAKKSFMGTLVRYIKRDDETKRYSVRFEDDLLKLYGEGYTLIDWEQRQALGKNNLAKWLQGHYATHAKPYPIKVETLHKLCGSQATLNKFREKLKAALDELVRVGSLKSWEILLGDLLSVKAVSSQSQLKHLSKSKRPGTA